LCAWRLTKAKITVDPRKSQTSTATPAKPGELLSVFSLSAIARLNRGEPGWVFSLTPAPPPNAERAFIFCREPYNLDFETLF
jgi:hypothetical protein